LKINIPGYKPKSVDGTLTVVLAALHPEPEVLELLHAQADVVVREAYSAQGVLRDLDGVRLVILDHLLTVPNSPLEMLKQTIAGNQIICITQQEFMTNPEEWISRARLTKAGQIQYLPARQVLITGWSGGVGKTTLSLTMAKCFTGRTGLPAAVLELHPGPGSVGPVCSGDYPDLFSILSRQIEPGKWEGVSLFPLDGRTFDVIWSEDSERMTDFLKDLLHRFTLVVVDAFPAHPLLGHLSDLMPDLTRLVISSPRPDAIWQGQNYLKEVPLPAYWIINQSTSLVDAGLDVAVRIQSAPQRAREFDPRLADPLLELVYPGWTNRLR
jgi:hypothetical protein